MSAAYAVLAVMFIRRIQTLEDAAKEQLHFSRANGAATVELFVHESRTSRAMIPFTLLESRYSFCVY